MKKNEESTQSAVTVLEETGFTAAQERVLRMRSGAPFPSSAPLGSKLDGVAAEHAHEVGAKLALLEALALEEMEAESEAVANALRNDERKTRIVDALRKLDSTEK